MSNIENELRRLGDSVRKEGSGAATLPPRQRRRIRIRRAMFAAAGAVTALALVVSASYGLGMVRDQRDIAPAEDASSVLIRFDRSGGFTSDHHVLTIKSDGSVVLESPGSRGLVEPIRYELEQRLMASLQDTVGSVPWSDLGRHHRGATPVGVADGYLYKIEHDGFEVDAESGLEPRSLRPLIDLLNGIIEERLSAVVTDGPRLRLSDAEVRPGDVVELLIDAPDEFVWGAMTPLELMTLEGWEPIYYWATYRDREPSPIQALRPGSGAVNDIGYSGGAAFKLEIPQLDPGPYRITKDFISQGSAPVGERTVVADVRFKLLADEQPRGQDRADMRRRAAADGTIDRQEAIRLAFPTRKLKKAKRVEASLAKGAWQVTLFQRLGCHLFVSIDATTGEDRGQSGGGCY